MKKIAPWKAGVLVSSIALAGGFVAYATWSFAPKAGDDAPAAPTAAGTAVPEDPLVRVEKETLLFSGSKSAIGIGGGPGAGFSGRADPKAPPREKAPDGGFYMGGSKSMPLPAPGDGTSK